MDYIEIIGYIASFITALGIMMKHIFWLRVFHMAGCISFAAYGFLIHSNPVIALNVFLIGVNSYYLFKMIKSR